MRSEISQEQRDQMRAAERRAADDLDRVYREIHEVWEGHLVEMRAQDRENERIAADHERFRYQ